MLVASMIGGLMERITIPDRALARFFACASGMRD
jgi:hypothetical protein